MAGPYAASRYNCDKSDGQFLELTDAEGNTVRTLKPQDQWTGKLWNLIHCKGEDKERHLSDEVVRIMGPYGTLHATCKKHNAVMLIGAGVGFPSVGGMLRQILEDNLAANSVDKKQVCFMWACSKVDQLHLCFPSLLADLSKYVRRSSLQHLREWLTVKIFVSKVVQGDVLNVELDEEVTSTCPDAFEEVKGWLLNSGISAKSKRGVAFDEDGTYIAQGNLGASFGDILRCSLFIKEKVVEAKRSLGICFCGPLDLCNWLQTDYANTAFPCVREFASECAGT